MPPTSETWEAYQKLVLSELKRLDEEMQRMNKCLQDIKGDIITLKLKSGLWGFAAGAIPAAMVIVLHAVKAL